MNYYSLLREVYMKKIITVLLSLILTLAVLTACDSGSAGGGENGGSSAGGFSVELSDNYAFVGGEGVRITLGANAPAGYKNKKLTAIIEGEDIAQVSEDGVITFSESGAVTVKGVIDGKESENSITLYGIYADEEIADGIAGVISAEPYLGMTADIGIKADTARLYKVSGDDGFAVINSEGLLEFTGARLEKSRIRIQRGDSVIYEGMYSTRGNGVSEAVVSYLRNKDLISKSKSSASNTEIASAITLSLSLKKALTDVGEYAFLKYFTHLEELTLEKMELFDL